MFWRGVVQCSAVQSKGSSLGNGRSAGLSEGARLEKGLRLVAAGG